MSEPQQQREFDAKMRIVAEMQVPMKRQMFSALRNDVSMHALVPHLGMTVAEWCMYLQLSDKQ